MIRTTEAMSGRAREEEDLPPSKRLKAEAEEKDGMLVPYSLLRVIP